MRSNRNKQTLLDKKMHQYLNEQEKFQQIEMKDFKNKTYHTPNYMRLNQQDNKTPMPHIKNPYQIYSQNTNNMKFWTDKPLAPKASYNDEPNKITLNGLTFVHKDAIIGLKKREQLKPKKPQMQVICESCDEAQLVPANTHAFICYSCKATQGCTPTYGIFICGCCQKNVWYMYGQSSYIKCTKCGTINNVPLNYESSKQKVKNQTGKYHQQIAQNNISIDELQSLSDQFTQRPFQNKYPQI